MSVAVMHIATIVHWQPRVSNTLRGFARVRLPSGMELVDVTIHVSGSKAWANPSSKAMIDRFGNTVKDHSGKIQYTPVVLFATSALRERFSNDVIEAMRRMHPEALE